MYEWAFDTAEKKANIYLYRVYVESVEITDVLLRIRKFEYDYITDNKIVCYDASPFKRDRDKAA